MFEEVCWAINFGKVKFWPVFLVQVSFILDAMSLDESFQMSLRYCEAQIT